MDNNLGLADSYSLQRLSHPIVTTHGLLLAKATCCTTLMSYVVCTSAAAPAFDMDSFALALTH